MVGYNTGPEQGLTSWCHVNSYSPELQMDSVASSISLPGGEPLDRRCFRKGFDLGSDTNTVPAGGHQEESQEPRYRCGCWLGLPMVVSPRDRTDSPVC